MLSINLREYRHKWRGYINIFWGVGAAGRLLVLSVGGAGQAGGGLSWRGWMAGGGASRRSWASWLRYQSAELERLVVPQSMRLGRSVMVSVGAAGQAGGGSGWCG